MKRVISVIVSCIFLIYGSGFVFSAQSGRITKTSSIKAVTVYTGRAMVTRELKTNVTAGRYTLAFSHLPLSLEDRSVRVTGKGAAAANILDVQVKREILSKPVTVSGQPLKNRQAAIKKESNALSDRMKALEKKEKFLEGLMNNTLESIAKSKNPQPVSLPGYKKMLDFLEERLNEVFAAKRQITENQEKLQEENKVIVEKLRWNPQADAKEVKTVLVDLAVKNAGELVVSVSYLVPDASWTPSYDLRIYPGQTKATLTYSAMVKQETGEDWENVQLALSTAQAMTVKSLPKLDPIYLDIVNIEKGMFTGVIAFAEDGSPLSGVTVKISGNETLERTTVTDEEGRFQFTNLPPGYFNFKAVLAGFNTYSRGNIRVYSGKTSTLNIELSPSSLRESIVVSGKSPSVKRYSPTDLAVSKKIIEALTETTEVSRSILASNFTIKHLDTVRSGRDASKVTVAIASVPVEKEHIAVPSRAVHAFLKAKIKNASEAPLLAGPINLFFDGNFVNTAQLGFQNPDQTFELPLGIDKSIQVERTLLEKESKIKGFFKRKTRIPLGYKITVENLKRNSVNVVLRDQIPVSKSTKVKILIEEINPQPEKREEEKPWGFLTWRLQLKPGEKKVITVKYVISHPKDAVLEEWQKE